jgi:hypothetical protein
LSARIGITPPFVTRARAQGYDVSPVAGLGPATHVLVATAPLFAESDLMGGWVYILTNRRNGTLYVGTTVDLARRVWEHREAVTDGFTKRYGLRRLVYAEHRPTFFRQNNVR